MKSTEGHRFVLLPASPKKHQYHSFFAIHTLKVTEQQTLTGSVKEHPILRILTGMNYTRMIVLYSKILQMTSRELHYFSVISLVLSLFVSSMYGPVPFNTTNAHLVAECSTSSIVITITHTLT